MPIQSRLHLFSLALAVLGAACAPAPDALGPTPGRSHRPRGGPPVPAPLTPDAGPLVWEGWAELAAYQVAVPRMPSQHLAADHEAETLANSLAAPYPSLGPARPLAPGAVLVQRLYAVDATTPEALFVMAKRASPGAAPPSTSPPEATDDQGWEYLVLDPDGLVSARGALEGCARCHAEAPYDHLFGRPR